MARTPIEKARLNRFAGTSVARYIDFVYRHSRVVIEPADRDDFLAAHRPAIIAVWHGQFLLAPKAKPLDVPLAIMLARHGDAELFANSLARFNTTLIRGAGAGERRKNRGGVYALRASLRTLDQNVFVGMTADVPPGPARRAGEGIVTLARMSGRPIIPLAAATSRYHALRTWSRMTINLPFGKLACVFGDPIFVPPDADSDMMEVARRAVEDGLDRATARAYQLAGADPHRATPAVGRAIGGALKMAGSKADDASSAGPGPVEPGPTESRPVEPGVSLRSYRAITRLSARAAAPGRGGRERRGREDRARRPERLGIARIARPEGCLVWIHAASVGELNAVLPLADALRRERSDLRFLFTSGTVTSAGVAAQRMAPGDIHQYVPLDSPRFVCRFLDHWHPDAAVLTESEIWPNLVLETSRRAIPLALVNARMSDRSYDRWMKMRSLGAPLFSAFDVVLAQNDKLAERFMHIGARRAIGAGNLKIDSPPPPLDEERLARLQEALGDRPVLVAASTHDGEERVIAAAHRLLAGARPTLCTVIAPRHPERGIEISEEMKRSGLKVALRSLGALPGEDTEIYIADTIGELGTIYALGPVAFVGGSLNNRGGQNPIEAVRCGAAVLTGPHWHNFRDAYDTLIEHGGAVVVSTAEELAEAFARLMADGTELKRMRSGAQAALSKLAGAQERTVAELLRLVPERKELVRAGA